MIRIFGLFVFVYLSINNIFPQEIKGLKDLTGKAVELKDYSSKFIIVNFWAVWCKPCVQEFPELNKMYLDLKDQGIAVLGVSITPSRDAVVKFLNKHKVDFPILIDENEKLADRFQVSALPTTLLIDTESNILYKYQGFSIKEMNNLRKIIEQKSK